MLFHATALCTFNLSSSSKLKEKRRLCSLTIMPQNVEMFLKHSNVSVRTTSNKIVKVLKAHRKLEKKWWKTSVGIYKLRTAVVLDKIASTPTFPHSAVLMEFLYCISTKQRESRWVLRNNNLTKTCLWLTMNSLKRSPMIDELLHCSVLNLSPISPKKCVRPDLIYSLSSYKWTEIFNFPVATRIEFVCCLCKQ